MEESGIKEIQGPVSSAGINNENVKRIEYDPVEFTINESDGRLIVRFTGRYDKEWIREIKSYGRSMV